MPKDRLTQKQIVADLLTKFGRVTLALMFQNGVGYAGRNRIGELRREGWVIRQENGKVPSENAWILVALPARLQPKNPWIEEATGQTTMWDEKSA